jgi:aryl-alcohol dehydrogenase-like predicted oxidoreductase
VRYRKIFNSNEKVSVIGLGTGYGGNMARISKYNDSHVRTIQFSIDLGITFIDTAEEYGMGEAEIAIGKAISNVRDRVFISTKVSAENLNYKNIIKSVEGSLKRLNTDYIDLYQNHWLNPLIPFEETLKAMDKLIQDGKIRYVGLCNVTLNELIKAKEYLTSDLLHFVQLEYNLVDREIEQAILPFCAKENIFIVAYSPLLQGSICRNQNKKRILKDIAKKYRKSISQIVLNWIIEKNQMIAIANTNNLDHLKENSESANFELSKSDLSIIDKTFLPNYIHIPAGQIHTHPTKEQESNDYRSIKDALENRSNMVPSPKELANDIMNGQKIKPIKIKKCISNNSKYDLIEGRLRYWAWVIANGEKPILAITIDE